VKRKLGRPSILRKNVRSNKLKKRIYPIK